MRTRTAAVAAAAALLLVLSVGGGAAADNSWDYFVLMEFWPASDCVGVQHSCTVPSGWDWFTLHGLWPNRNDTTYPSFCTSEAFDESQVSGLLSDMKQYWTDFYDPSGTTFWQHEWSKHGTCALSDPLVGSQYLYFSKALALRKQVDVLQVLADAGIVPSASQSYSIDAINAALDLGDYSGFLYCSWDSSASQQLLFAVSFCVDKNLNFMRCNEAFVQQYPGISGCRTGEPVFMTPPPQ